MRQCIRLIAVLAALAAFATSCTRNDLAQDLSELPALEIQVRDAPSNAETEQVSTILRDAARARMLAYGNDDASYVAQLYAEPILQVITNTMAETARQEMRLVPDIKAIRVIDVRPRTDSAIDADICETFLARYYRLSDGVLLSVQPPATLPQTITMERRDSQWIITNIAFMPPPGFCGQAP
jgi:hypothetical protein